jgi:hypothetical protein
LYRGVKDFLQKQAQVEVSSQAQIAVERRHWSTNYSQAFLQKMTDLHLPAYFGVDDAAGALLDSNSRDAKDRYC